MKKDMVKRNLGDQVLLVPQAYRLDKYGFEVRPVREDDWWLIESVEDEGVTIREPGTGHCRLLGYDHIKSYPSDGVKADVKRGQLLLNVQVGSTVGLRLLRPVLSSHPNAFQTHSIDGC